MFEDKTAEKILADCLAAGPAGIDKRQGGIFYDAVAAVSIKLAAFYADLDQVCDLVSIDTAPDEYLDRKGSDYNLFRNPATPARYAYDWTGTAAPAAGERFFTDGRYFVLKQGAQGDLSLEAETPGGGGNDVPAGRPAVPVNNLAGLAASAFGELIEPGADTESDAAYRRRIQEKISGPADNGNRQHYKTWCESFAQVGRARIVPCFAGDNSVLAVLTSPEGGAVTQAVVDEVQAYIDPRGMGLTVEAGGETFAVGDGLGNGIANIGAHFAAISAEPVAINVGFLVELAAGRTIDAVKSEFGSVLAAYLRDLSINAPEGQNAVVRLSAINALIYDIPGIVDYRDLRINGAAANVELTARKIAVAGEAAINAI